MRRLCGFSGVKRSVLIIAAVMVGSLAGCGDNTAAKDKKPREDEAAEMVWRGIYNMATEIPSIIWIEGAALNCADGHGFQTELGCRGGLSWPNNNIVELAWFEGLALHDTDLAHEFCHRRSMVLIGDGDGDHVGPCWREPGDDVSQPYSDRRGMVGHANAVLDSADM